MKQLFLLGLLTLVLSCTNTTIKDLKIDAVIDAIKRGVYGNKEKS